MFCKALLWEKIISSLFIPALFFFFFFACSFTTYLSLSSPHSWSTLFAIRQHSLIVEADYSYNSYALIDLNNSDLSISQKCFHCSCIFLTDHFSSILELTKLNSRGLITSQRYEVFKWLVTDKWRNFKPNLSAFVYIIFLAVVYFKFVCHLIQIQKCKGNERAGENNLHPHSVLMCLSIARIWFF